jgi:hypothetical protein
MKRTSPVDIIIHDVSPAEISGHAGVINFGAVPENVAPLLLIVATPIVLIKK